MSSPSRASGRSVNVAQLVSMFLAFLLVAGVAGVLSAGFLMPMVAAMGATTQAGYDTFQDLDTEIGDMTMSERSVIRYSNGAVMATFYAEDRIVVPLEEISPHVQNAVVAVEDKRFFEHGAIDPEGMLRAVVSNLSGGDLQGASTLTQQYVKNVLLEQARIEQDAQGMADATAPTIGRKLREAKLAIALEQSYTKNEILNGYLNIAQFGPSQYGIEAAARYFFSKSAIDLNIGEAALLAGITQSPGSYNPLVNPENAFDRRNTVLYLMEDQGYITAEEYEQFSAVPIADMLAVQPIPPTCATAEKSAYFCDYVVKTILTDPTFGEEYEDRRQLLLRGGLDITTTLNPELQDEGFASLTAAVPIDDESGISNAISTVEPGTGRILAMVQNTPYGEGGEEGDPARTTKVNFNADAEYGGSIGFQTGSTFKAFVLAAWLESGRSLYDIVDGAPGQSFPRSSWNYDGCTNFAGGEAYEPRNIEGIGTGRLRVLDATIRSVNTAFVNMANQLNMCDLYDLTQRLGLHVGSGIHADSELPLYPSPSMTLGANNIAPLTMAAAFATFAANGTFCTPIAIDKILDADGNEVAVPTSQCSEAIEPEVAATVTFALQNVVESNDRQATGRQARISGYEIAGKTGTANNDYAAWFIGYTPQVATAVWNGFSEGQIPMMDITINGRYHRLVYGGAFAAPIWQGYMSQAVETLGLTPESFPDPNDELVFGERKWVPNVGGMSVEQATAALERAGFSATVGSSEEHDSIPEGSVIRTQPGAGSLQTQGSTITLITSDGPPPPPEQPSTEPPSPEDGGDGGDGGGGGGGGGGGDDDDDDRPGNPNRP
ncbi:penicillin-binding protein [Pseudactinotalea terrae]|uniref:penicillin-binding protein n=1 Tax=Pseudactinotalea terrae TaxID=1743262 RepID=UPI00139188A2|nr:transglycosylase domain-containing protein [Pseudactinotalea terrae]